MIISDPALNEMQRNHFRLITEAIKSVSGITLGSESPAYLFNAHRQISKGYVSPDIMLTICHMALMMREQADEMHELRIKQAKPL